MQKYKYDSFPSSSLTEMGSISASSSVSTNFTNALIIGVVCVFCRVCFLKFFLFGVLCLAVCVGTKCWASCMDVT